MLISNESLQQIDAEIGKVFEELLKFIEGDRQSLSLLEQVYIAGKVASALGPDALREMTAATIAKYAKDHAVAKTREDEAVLKLLQSSTRKWVAGMQDEFNKRVRVAIATAEEMWANEVILRSPDGTLKKAPKEDNWAALRDLALAGLAVVVTKVFSFFEATVDRFLQTELAKYFQMGQASEISSDEEVYKMPRPTACPHCFRLHMDSQGRPIVYRLRDVQGNTNVGKKANEWQFVLGPVHPHCYCILYRVKQKPPKASDLMANARKESLAVGLKKRKEILEEAKRRYQEALALAGESTG